MGEQACLEAMANGTLTSFEDDSVTVLSNWMLSGFSNLTSVKLPSCVALCSNALANCASLETVDILGGYNQTGTGAPYAYGIDSSVLANTPALKALVMRANAITTISYNTSWVFGSSGILKGTGAVYVNDGMLDAYRSHSQWSKYNLIILPISEYPRTGSLETVSDTWAEIAAASANGTYSSKYRVGDLKELEIDGSTYLMQLVGMDADVLASDGTTPVPMTWMSYRQMHSVHAMNSQLTTVGGWEQSTMRSWLADTVMQQLPAEVQSAIKEVRKYSRTYESGAAVPNGCVTADKLWIPSANEVLSSTAYETLGPKYTILSTANSYGRAKFRDSASSSTYFLRTCSNATQYRHVANSTDGSSNANITQGVCLGFCI